MNTALFRYIVREGDTLYKLSARFSASPEILAALNNLENPNVINSGSTLLIPVSAEFAAAADLVSEQLGHGSSVTPLEDANAVPTLAPAADDYGIQARAFERYRVRDGDTIYMLAKKYGTTVGNILGVNPSVTDVTNLQIGSMLTIPLPPRGAYIYIVRPGDTIYKISQSQGVSQERLLEYNFVDGDFTIYPGQQLLIVK